MAAKQSKSGPRVKQTARRIGTRTRRKDKPTSYLPKDDAGNVKAGPGRPKGSINKSHRQAKENISLVFEMLGSVERMYKWATLNDENLGKFYMNIYTRLIPVHLQAEFSGEVELKTREELLAGIKSLFDSVLESRPREARRAPVIIDAEPVGDTTPQLVVSRQT